MKYNFLFKLFILMTSQSVYCQDTFSIVALDSTTRQVASAGASCVDLFVAGYSNPAFLADIIPDSGAVNTQSYYMQANQDNARIRMRAGDTPQQIISWLVANDANSNPEFKQYGIVGFNGNSPSSASHTGTSCINYKNHINGSINGMYYAIQGNILKGQEILDSMEAGFRNTNGNLACRMMAAMKGANVVGADTRCNTENTSSLFAFLQVAKSNDLYGFPTINLKLRTASGAGIEPVDSLQKMFDAINGCGALSINQVELNKEILCYPNPTNELLYFDFKKMNIKNAVVNICNIFGQCVISKSLIAQSNSIYVSGLRSGIYSVQVINQDKIKYRTSFFKYD
jgi:uncharacterized Ntn-hydrolase superfamily protein